MAASISAPAAAPSPLATAEINPQSLSMLYTRIPQEIRDLIFTYAMTPYTPPMPQAASLLYPSTSTADLEYSPYSRETQYTRPGHISKPHLKTYLPQLCRRTYRETSLLVAQTKEHTFWHPAESAPPGCEEGEEKYFARLPEKQRLAVRDITLFVSQEWLESNGLEELSTLESMRSVRRLRLVVRWCGWKGWERNKSLGLNPYGPAPAPSPTTTDADEEFGNPSVSLADGWGSAFSKFAALRDLTIEFETSDDRKTEMSKLVAQAKQNWQFPAANGRVLRTDPLAPLQWNSWEGPMCAWSNFCAHCCGAKSGERDCVERTRRRRRDLGPLLHIVAVQWTAGAGERDW